MEPLDASDGAAAGPAGGGGGGGGRYEVWNFRIVATAFLWHQAHPPPPLPYEPDADLSPSRTNRTRISPPPRTNRTRISPRARTRPCGVDTPLLSEP